MTMVISEIYRKYKIMPMLQMHMLRVAVVAEILCENFMKNVDKKSIITACLLHDMGNIASADLSLYPEGLGDKNVDYWNKIQKEFERKYGNNREQATYKILDELGISEQIQRIVKLRKNYIFEDSHETRDINCLVCHYADLRVSPVGIVTVEERLEEWKRRFFPMYHKFKPEVEKEVLENYMLSLEPYIMQFCRIQPEDITNEVVELKLKQLEEYNVPTA